MKKFIPLLLKSFCFIFLACNSFSQQLSLFDYSLSDPEKIYLFDVKIDVQTNGKIKVTENITNNVRYDQKKEKLFREIPIALTGKVEDISLTMNGEKYPFSTEKYAQNFRINFGNSDYTNTGMNTYTFTYTFTGAIKSLKDYDELYWNVTGNYWDLNIDKVRVQVVFPENVNIQKDKISFYTGKEGQESKIARQTDNLTFETTSALTPGESFTVVIPFDKGIIKQSFFKSLNSTPLTISIIFFVILIIYLTGTWFKIGRDPIYLAMPRYEPPQKISPAFAYFLYNDRWDTKLVSCIILDLAMKGYLSIEIKNEGFSKHTFLICEKRDTKNLPEEEALFMNTVFKNADFCIVDKSTDIGTRLNKFVATTLEKFAKKRPAYILSNKGHICNAILLTLILGVMPFYFPWPQIPRIDITYINIWYLVFLLPVGLIPSTRLKIIVSTIFMAAFCSIWVTADNMSLDLVLCQILYAIGSIGVIAYMNLIQNVTPLGKEILEQLTGFRKYIETAEVNRVAASNPTDAKRIFCDYLPYAFALNIQNKWMQEFTNILSKAAIEQCTACVGGITCVSSGLTNTISFSMAAESEKISAKKR